MPEKLSDETVILIAIQRHWPLFIDYDGEKHRDDYLVCPHVFGLAKPSSKMKSPSKAIRCLKLDRETNEKVSDRPGYSWRTLYLERIKSIDGFHESHFWQTEYTYDLEAFKKEFFVEVFSAVRDRHQSQEQWDESSSTFIEPPKV